jgi:class 3 adenylate cyclase
VSIAYQVLGEGELDIVFVPGVISHLDLLWEDAATSGFYRRLATRAVAPPTQAAGPAGNTYLGLRAAARRTVQARRGRLVHSTGERVLATFDGPGRALRCATALRDTAQTLGIQIRVGIHTGEVENRGQGITGTAVEIAANVAALARPSQILATRTVKDLVAGSGITFLEHGPQPLAGLPGQWLLFAVGNT